MTPVLFAPGRICRERSLARSLLVYLRRPLPFFLVELVVATAKPLGTPGAGVNDEEKGDAVALGAGLAALPLFFLQPGGGGMKGQAS